MSTTLSDDIATFRRELDDLRKRVDLMEMDLNTRIAAAESKQAADVEALNRKWDSITVGMQSMAKLVANLASQQKASHYSVVHLLAVTARQVKVADADLKEAMRLAEEAMKTE